MAGNKKATEQTVDSLELYGYLQFWQEMQRELTGPTGWVRDPQTLLSDLRILERWRKEIITDNITELAEYKYTVHREKKLLFSLPLIIVREMVVNLRAVKATSQLPACPDRLEKFARGVEAVQCGTDDAQCVYELSRILGEEIRTMEAFCKLKQAGPVARQDQPQQTIPARTPNELPFGITCIEKTNSVSRKVPVIGEMTCEISNPQQRQLFDALISANGRLKASVVRHMFTDRNYRAGIVRYLSEHLQKIQLTIAHESGNGGFYTLKVSSE